MTTYRITMMTKENYNNMMCGYAYCDTTVIVEANNETEARATIDNNMIVTTVVTVANYEAEKKAIAEKVAKADTKKAEAVAKRQDTERAKAEAMGMTVEEYRKDKAKKAQIAKLEKEIAEMEKQIAYKKRRIAELMK